MKIGEMLKRVGDPGGRFTGKFSADKYFCVGETKLTRSLKKAVEQPQRGLGTRKSSSLSQLSDTFMKKMQNKQDERTGSAGIFLTMPPETSMGMSPRVNGQKRGMTTQGGRNMGQQMNSATNAINRDRDFFSPNKQDDKWLRAEVEREKMKIARFIETQERRVDGLSAREANLQKRMQDKDKKVATTEKNLIKTRREQSLVLQAATNERLNKGKMKKTEDA